MPDSISELVIVIPKERVLNASAALLCASTGGNARETNPTTCLVPSLSTDTCAHPCSAMTAPNNRAPCARKGPPRVLKSDLYKVGIGGSSTGRPLFAIRDQ